MAAVFVSIGSIYLQERQADQAALRARDAEAQRHRRELAETPLRSLVIEWSFKGNPAQLRPPQPGRASAGACSAEWERTSEPQRRNEFYPFLVSLATGRGASGPVVLLFALDDAPEPANVLPLGMLATNVKREDALEWNQTKPDTLKSVAATIEFVEDLDQCLDTTVRNLPSPVIDRPRRCDPKPLLRRTEDAVTLRWDLGANCIASGVDRTDGSAGPTALLPVRMRALLFTQIGDFPRSPENFAKWGPLLPWESGRPRPDVFQDRSQLKLVPNGEQGDEAEYEMRFHQSYLLRGKGGGAQVQHAYPLVATWVSSAPPAHNGVAAVPVSKSGEKR